ncbi:hypothetical protein, partial [Halorubrum sp. SD626R]|uniref:hypothetical protein n=1 Tax=Halorubrum sp. SD626R TaxID=1419722 RepID=UPI001A7E7007
MGKATKKCPHCGTPVKPKKMERHLFLVHEVDPGREKAELWARQADEDKAKRKAKRREKAQKRKEKAQEWVVCKRCGLEMQRKHLKKHMRRKHPGPKALRLFSRRGTRVSEPQQCEV